MTDRMISAKKALVAKLGEISHSAGWRENIAIEHTADPLDTTQRALELEMATRNLDRNANLVRQIRDAMARVENGEYGICLECEEPISQKRLAALPWAALCIQCQEHADQGRQRVVDSSNDGFANAA